MILYAPRSSVRIERDFSINTGLLASTDTPGKTAPLWSLTIPVKVLWALPSGASVVKQRNNKRTPAATGILIDFLILPPSQISRHYGRAVARQAAAAALAPETIRFPWPGTGYGFRYGLMSGLTAI